MKLSDKEILFASLLGNRIVNEIPNFKKLENKYNINALPIPPNPLLNQKTNVESVNVDNIENSIWEASPKQSIEDQYFPLRLSKDNVNWFLLPYEPILNISGGSEFKKISTSAWTKNKNKKENVRGTVKSLISEKDYEITITGVLMGKQLIGRFEDCFPREDFTTLRGLLEHNGHLYVNSPLLAELNIHRLIVESFDFPFSKGENVQGYVIKCISDQDFSENENYGLLIP